jgi:hypothetical protein
LANEKYENDIEIQRNLIEFGVQDMNNRSKDFYQENVQLKEIIRLQSRLLDDFEEYCTRPDQKDKQEKLVSLLIERKIIQKRFNQSQKSEKMSLSEIEEIQINMVKKIEKMIKEKVEKLGSKDISSSEISDY